MSIEAVNQFLTKVNQDPQLQAKVERAIERNARQAVTELGAKHGYQFTPNNYPATTPTQSNPFWLSWGSSKAITLKKK